MKPPQPLCLRGKSQPGSGQWPRSADGRHLPGLAAVNRAHFGAALKQFLQTALIVNAAILQHNDVIGSVQRRLARGTDDGLSEPPGSFAGSPGRTCCALDEAGTPIRRSAKTARRAAGIHPEGGLGPPGGHGWFGAGTGATEWEFMVGDGLE